MSIELPLPRAAIASLCRRHHVRRLVLFGSVTGNEFGPDSDIDVLVEFEPGHTPGLAFFALQAELSELLGRDVDLNTPAWLGTELRERIRDQERIIYAAA